MKHDEAYLAYAAQPSPVMTVWHLIDRETGKLVVSSTSRDALERECAWRDVSIPSNRYEVKPEQREMYNERWDCCARPSRYAAPWPEAKVQEFVRRYNNLEPLSKMEERFDSPISSLLQRARRLGLPKRNKDNPKWRRKVVRRQQKRELEATARFTSQKGEASEKEALWQVRREALEAMKAADYSVSDMAEAMGVSPQTIDYWKRQFGMKTYYERQCMRCSKEFRSNRPQTRLCRKCRSRNVLKTASDRILPRYPGVEFDPS